jgi:hypothetical protein
VSAAVTFPGCFHCLLTDHWQDACPLLRMPDGKKQHEARIAEFTRRFVELEIGPVAKTRMITKENELWKKRQKELARL